MAKSTRSLEERIQEKDLQAQKLMEKANQYEAQRKQLVKLQQEEDIPKLIAFLKKQEANGGFLTKAMQKSPDKEMN